MNMNRKELLQQYIDTNLEVSKESLRKKDDQVFYDCMEMASFSVGSKKAIYKEGSIDEYIKNNNDEDKFQKLLFQYIDSKGLKDSDVYNKVNIDRRLFSKIRNESYHPSIDTIILLALSLELTEEELDKLLNSASYTLPKNNVRDLIIRFCFKEKIYNLFEMNDLLLSYICLVFE